MTTSTLTIGAFGFSTTATRWTWSDGMFTLHGMTPGDVVPTRALFLSHVHPEDRERVGDVLDACTRDDEPHACTYRLVELTGEVRTVLLALAPTGDDPSTVSGFVVDDSARQRREIATAVNAELEVALESHAAIDQAKGMLMMVYGIDGDAAFEILRWASQQCNVRLRLLAERLVQAVCSTGGMGARARSAVDELVVAAMGDVPLPAARRQDRRLDVSFDRRPAGPTMAVRGHVDATTMAELASALGRLMSTGRDAQRVVVDLSEVEDVGAVARTVLQVAQRRSAARGVTMDLVGEQVPQRAVSEPPPAERLERRPLVARS